MGDLRKLNRAVQSAEYPSHEWAQAVREMLNEVAERMEPASEGAKVECPNCGQPGEHYHSGDMPHVPAFYTCQPAQPEPAAPEEISELDDRHNRMASPEYQAKVKADMDRRAVEIGADRLVGVASRPDSETVTVGAWQLEDLLKYADYAEVALRTGFHPPDFIFATGDRSLRQAIDVIKKQRDEWPAQPEPAASVAMPDSGAPEGTPYEIAEAVAKLSRHGEKQEAHNLAGWWMRLRTHAAQPQVAMSPDLEDLLDSIMSFADVDPDTQVKQIWRRKVAAVRAQASQPVKLEKVRRALKCGQERLNIVFLSEETTTRWNNLFYEALAELDAAEGKAETKEGK